MFARRLVVLLALFLTLPCLLMSSEWAWSLKEYELRRISIANGKIRERTFKEYYLYYSSEKSREIDQFTDDSGIIYGLYLLKPTPKVMREMREGGYIGESEWILQVCHSSYGCTDKYDAFAGDIWVHIPDIAKKTLVFLKEEKCVILIGYRMYSGSMIVWLHPRFGSSKAMHKHYLTILRRYFDGINSSKEGE